MKRYCDICEEYTESDDGSFNYEGVTGTRTHHPLQRPECVKCGEEYEFAFVEDDDEI